MKPEILALLPEDMTLRQARKLLTSQTPADFVEAFNGELKDITWADFIDIAKVISIEQQKAWLEALKTEAPAPKKKAAKKRKRKPTATVASRFKALPKGLTAKQVAQRLNVKVGSVYVMAKRHGYKLKKVRK
jgi:hypothetical protein